ncbi:MAG: DUF6713 family protein [Chloroflexota bacterium]
MIDWLIWLNLAWLIGHELDAIQQHEWRFFAQPFTIDDDHAYQIFTLLHVPAMVLILWAMALPAFGIGLSVFLIVHALVHFALRNHDLITFDSALSRLMIYAPIPTSIVYFFLVYTG